MFHAAKNFIEQVPTIKFMGRTRFMAFQAVLDESGAGGGRMWMEESEGKKINIERVTEAVETGADEVAVACPFCYIMIDDGVKELGKDEHVRVRDVSLILLDNLKKD